ncbi:MAG: hypothetical protein U1D55_03555 [Phycisphaerae bacterium]
MGCDWTDEEAEGEVTDDDLPQESDVGDDDETETLPCPNCRREVAEDSPRCPHCGDYLVPGAAPTRRQQKLGKIWFVLGVLLLLAWLIYSLRR